MNKSKTSYHSSKSGRTRDRRRTAASLAPRRILPSALAASLSCALVCTNSLAPATCAYAQSPQLAAAMPATTSNQTGPASATKKTTRRNPYAAEIRIQQNSAPIGSAPVSAVPKASGTDPSISQEYPDNAPQNSVDFHQALPLKALVSVENTLNPFTLDADRIEPVTYREVLLAAEHGNLDILGTRYGAQAQKYLYSAAMTQFLPDINLAYSKLLVNGTIPIPISAEIKPTANAISAITAPATTATIIKTPISIVQAGFTLPVWKSENLFNLLSQKHGLAASKAQLSGSLNDTLLTASQNYYNLLLNQALLEIREQAVEISEEQLRMNTALESSGLATNLDILQSRAQLARDRQNLVDQQRIRRNSSIQLAHTLNASLAQDLVPSESVLRKSRLIARTMPVTSLLSVAIDNRPELKQYDELRQVAKAAIYNAVAPMTPSVNFGGSIYGIGTDLGSLGPLWLLNFGVQWKFGGLGLTELQNAQSAKWKARQALVEANKQFLNVFDQVRTSFNDGLSAERRIDQAIEEIAAAEEELRLARIRLETGLGINIDVLNAQRDLTQARVDKAQAICDFNIAQAQLVHNIGLINVDNLTSGNLISSNDVHVQSH